MVRLFRGISKFVDLLLEISESYASRNYTKFVSSLGNSKNSGYSWMLHMAFS